MTEPRTIPVYLSLEEAAEAMSVSVKTIRRWIAAGTLPAYRCGKRAIRSSSRTWSPPLGRSPPGNPDDRYAIADGGDRQCGRTAQRPSIQWRRWAESASGLLHVCCTRGPLPDGKGPLTCSYSGGRYWVRTSTPQRRRSTPLAQE